MHRDSPVVASPRGASSERVSSDGALGTLFLEQYLRHFLYRIYTFLRYVNQLFLIELCLGFSNTACPINAVLRPGYPELAYLLSGIETEVATQSQNIWTELRVR